MSARRTDNLVCLVDDRGLRVPSQVMTKIDFDAIWRSALTRRSATRSPAGWINMTDNLVLDTRGRRLRAGLP